MKKPSVFVPFWMHTTYNVGLQYPKSQYDKGYVSTIDQQDSLYIYWDYSVIYGNCWRYQDGGRLFIYSLQCAKAVGRYTAEITVGRKGLGYAIGWYKRDELPIKEEDISDFFGGSAINNWSADLPPL